MKFDHLNSNEDDGLMSIEDLRTLRLRKKKIERDKRARKYLREEGANFWPLLVKLFQRNTIKILL